MKFFKSVTTRILKAAQSLQAFAEPIYVEGRSFKQPASHYVKAQPSEPWMAELLSKLLPLKHGSFVDVGVNLGQTLLKVKALEPDRSYIGFEPNPSCVTYVEQLVLANELANCRIVPAALGLSPQLLPLSLFFDGDTDAAASIVPDFRPGERVLRTKFVAMLSINEFPPDFFSEPVGLVKIDVEGAEADVLKALTPILKRDRPIILVEILPCYSEDRTDRVERQEHIENLLTLLNYQLTRVRTTARPVALDPVESIGIHSDISQCEYVAHPTELVTSMKMTFS